MIKIILTNLLYVKIVLSHGRNYTRKKIKIYLIALNIFHV